MTKTVNLANITGGRMIGEIRISAEYWETRYSWGHSATVKDMDTYTTLGYCKIRYYNRTWESYRFKSALHGAIYDYVKGITGIDPFKESKRDARPMKNHGAEYRRLARLEARQNARDLYDNLCGIVDGTRTEEGIKANGGYTNVA